MIGTPSMNSFLIIGWSEKNDFYSMVRYFAVDSDGSRLVAYRLE